MMPGGRASGGGQKKEPGSTASCASLVGMTEQPLCRCGKPAPLDVTITASAPFKVDGPNRTELQFSTVACRACAFEAAKLKLAFLEKEAQA